MTIKANAWCTVLCTKQDFTAIPEIGRLHKGLGSKSCHFGILILFFKLRTLPVYLGFDVGSGD